MKAKKIEREITPDIPKEGIKLIQEMQAGSKPKNFEENHAFYSQIAKKTYEAFGNHVPMLFLFNSELNVIDFLSTQFDDTASKYIFWRRVADRITYLTPTSLTWISEAWIRGLDKTFSKPIRSLPIQGEMLQICSLDKTGKILVKNWKIDKKSEDEVGVISGSEDFEFDSKDPNLNFLIPAISAFGIKNKC